MFATPRTFSSALLAALLILSVEPTLAWADEKLDPQVEQGLELLSKKSCTACHTTDGRSQVGPTFLGYFGSEITVSSGGEQRRLRVDAEQVRRSVREPNAAAQVGYPTNVMPTLEVSDTELDAIVAALAHLADADVVTKRKRSDGSIVSVVLAVLAFVLGHLFLSSVPVRTRLIGKLGEGWYTMVYSLYASVVLTWVIWAYIVAPYVPLWTPRLWTSWVPLVSMPIVMILMCGSFVPGGGMTTITRHPQLWAQGIWGLCHLPPNGDLATVMLFGGLAALSFAGMIHIELRKRAHPDEKWRALTATTSVIPFAAIIGGRNGLSLERLALPVGVGVAAYVGFLSVHELLMGKSPFPY